MDLKEMNIDDIELLIEECREELSNRKKQEKKKLADELNGLLLKAHELDVDIVTSEGFYLDDVYFNIEYSEEIEIRGWYD